MADVDVPKVGKVDKKTLFVILGGAVAFVGYRYWKARQDVGDGEPVDLGYEDPGTLPGVAGAVKPDNSYGSGDGGTGGSTGGGFRGLTNSEWSEYVLDRLQTDGKWTHSTIAVALGNYLTAKPTSSEQQDIVRAAIGIAGYPPVSGYALVGGGNTAITVAPSGVIATATGPTTIRLTFPSVPGAATYNAYVAGSARGTSSSSPLDVTGLTPGTSYSIQVAAVSASGQIGPKSSVVTGKTQSAAMGAPAKPTVTLVQGNRVTFKTSTVPYATRYDWFLNGKIFNSTTGPAVTLTNLKNRARYSPGVSVRAGGPTGTSKTTAATSFTTK